jgi:glycolate oxidase FAD binding subunit
MTSLPILETLTPTSQEEVCDIIRHCADRGSAIYPIGGGTSVDYGLPARREGIGLSLAKLNRILDYPARDMTVTVEAGVTMRGLSDALAAEKQRLPIDVSHADQATLGGVVATNANGPLRFGHGTTRDHVIGITAVDGHGDRFEGGGRVVKNVAGYDFCKLLTGSMGTLAVITQVTLKLIPQPQQMVIVIGQADDLDHTEALLAALMNSQTSPSAVEVMTGPLWKEDPACAQNAPGGENPDMLVAVALEGTEVEVGWMTDQLDREWSEMNVATRWTLGGRQASALLERWAEFPGRDAPLALEGKVAPSHTTNLIKAAQDVDPEVDILAHAGNGCVMMQFPEFPAEGLSRVLLARLQPVATRGHGNIVVTANPSGQEMTRQSVWGGIDAPFELMRRVKREFDPRNVLNPDRFVY